MASSSRSAGPAAADHRAWSELPVDVLHNIVGRVSTPSLPGVVLVSGVCSSWRQATLDMPVGEVATYWHHSREPRPTASLSSWLRRYGPGITRLSFYGTRTPEPLRDAAASGALSRLQFLDARLAIHDPRDAGVLREMPELQELRGAYVRFTDGAADWRALHYFRLCTCLTKLELCVDVARRWQFGVPYGGFYTAAADNAFQQLWGCMPTSLQCLDLQDADLGFPPHLTVLTGLKELQLTYQDCGDLPGPLQAALPPALRSLSIVDLNGDLLPRLPALSSVLHSLTVWGLQLDDDVIPSLQHLPSLQQLTALTSLEVEAGVVQPEWFLPGLQHLSLQSYSARFNNASALRHLSALSSLRTLQLLWWQWDPDCHPDEDAGAAADAEAAAALVHAQQLTRLVVHRPRALRLAAGAINVQQAQVGGNAWASALQRLVQLKELEVDEVLLDHPQPWLTALTALTALTVQSVWLVHRGADGWQLQPGLVSNLQAAAACGRLSKVVVEEVYFDVGGWGGRLKRWFGYGTPLPRRFDVWAQLQAAVPALLVEVKCMELLRS